MKEKDTNSLIKKQEENASVYVRESVQKDQAPQINKYYLKVSGRYRIGKIASVGLLCIVILSSLLIYSESFTYENARYILRDIGQILSDDSSDYAQRISIQADGNMDFDIFKGSLVVAGESGIKIISTSGKEKLSDDTKFTSPTIVTSYKYCIVYSLGAYNLSVYNTVARVYDMTFDFPIYDVALSDNGYFAVMTHTRENRCVVYLYDSNFNLCATYKKNKYPSSVGITENGEMLFISTFASHDGDYLSEITAYKQKSTESEFTYNISGSLPLAMQVFSNDSVSVLYSDRVIFLDNAGNGIGEYSFSADVFTADTNREYITLVEGDSVKRVHVYNYNGKLIRTLEDTNLTRAYTFDGNSLLQSKSVLYYSADDVDVSFELNNNTAKILYNNGYIFICYSDSIYTHKIKLPT